MWNPFTVDDEGDIIDLSRAIQRAQDEIDFLNSKEDEMATKVKKTQDTPKKVTKKTQKAEAPEKKIARPRRVPEGYVGIKDLAKELNLSPIAIRRKLRTSEVEKPEGQFGWFWKEGSKALASVKKALA